jgi:glycosyltransferase involved in cell wall biosynthesis
MSAHNARATIGYAAKSILGQTYRNLELLIGDDGSDDGTLQTARSEVGHDPRVRFFRSESNHGPYGMRNALLPVVRGELVTFQDADDFSLPSRLESQVRHLAENNVVACVTRWLRVREDGQFVFFSDQAALRMSVVSLMAPRRIFELDGPYRSARFAADTDFLERLRATYGDQYVTRVKAPQILALWSPNSLTMRPGSEALLDGFRAPARRAYSQAAFLQRFLGAGVVSDDAIHEVLRSTDNASSDAVVTEQGRAP